MRHILGTRRILDESFRNMRLIIRLIMRLLLIISLIIRLIVQKLSSSMRLVPSMCLIEEYARKSYNKPNY